MKSKNIPADISKKTIKEAQNEINEIIEKLEDRETNLENVVEHYNRMIQLNHHIQRLFKEKANEIKRSSFDKSKKNLLKK
tara:strand:+ start:1396 stop:1635 length:240 start_codon:yes stop_codon:yes gene_type:complete